MEVISKGIQLAITLDSVVYPVDLEKFISKLHRVGGYSPARPNNTTPKGVPVQQGDTAIKGDVVINLHTNFPKIVLVGMEGDEISPILNEIKTAFDECGGNSDKIFKYYEFLSQHEISTEKNALDTIPLFLNSVSTSEINKILDAEFQLHTIKFISKNPDYNSKDYSEIAFEPLRRNFGKSYFCSIEYRTKDYKKFRDFLYNINKKIKELISTIEK